MFGVLRARYGIDVVDLFFDYSTRNILAEESPRVHIYGSDAVLKLPSPHCLRKVSGMTC